MSAFFKDYLDSSSKVHDAAVAASLAAPKPSSSSAPSFNVAPPPAEKSEAAIAAEHAAKTGRRVDVNEDGEIIDKRQLMAGGLNVVAKPRAPGQQVGGFAAAISERKEEVRREDRPEAFSVDGLTKEERARQTRQRHSEMIERQMAELEVKRKREAEEQLEQKVQKVAKRNDETKVEELKRKAEERRLKREEDARKAKEGGA